VGRIGRSVAIGAGVGVALSVVLAVAAFAYEAYRTRGMVESPSTVIVVFAIEGEDGGPIAHTAAVVTPGGEGRPYYLLETSVTVSTPGLSDARLSDTYAFGGARGLAEAHDGGELRPSTAWVDVPPSAWEALLGDGVELTLANNFDVFDGERLFEFPAGPQQITGEQLRALANGIEYLDLAERRAVREAIAAASLKALVSRSAPPKGASTNLTAGGWTRLAAALSGGAGVPAKAP
jgi:hypothetical protein